MGMRSPVIVRVSLWALLGEEEGGREGGGGSLGGDICGLTISWTALIYRVFGGQEMGCSGRRKK